MKKMYLDQNIWLDIQLKRFNNSPEDLLEKLNRDKIEIIYSPANIEEICNSYCSPNIQTRISAKEKDSFLDLLSKITRDRGIIPYSRGYEVLYSFCMDKGPFIVLEPPEKCFQRVHKFYSSNVFAESSQKSSIDKSREIDQLVKGKLGHKKFLDILEEDPSAKELFVETLKEKLIHKSAIDNLIKSNVNLQPWTYHTQRLAEKIISELLNNQVHKFVDMAQEIILKKDITTRGFSICEAAIDSLMLTMIKYGYASEKSPMSSLHDNSHSIYGAYCDFFVSRDPRLIKKLTSTYDIFGIKTKIIDANKEDWRLYIN